MLSKLAKIANRLDSLGLTKEADVLDSFIRKIATTPPLNADVANLPYKSTFPSGMRPEEIQPQPGSPFLRTDTVGWEKYEAATGMIGTTVRQTWARYTQSGAAGVDPSFKSFTSWYNNQLKNVWGGKHKSPSEIIKLLSERATAQARAGNTLDLGSSWNPDRMAGTAANPSSGEQASSRTSLDDPNSVSINMTPEQRNEALRSLRPGEGTLGDRVLGISR